MVPSLPLLSRESLVSMKENLIEKKSILQAENSSCVRKETVDIDIFIFAACLPIPSSN